jgi:hypothetical protein
LTVVCKFFSGLVLQLFDGVYKTECVMICVCLGRNHRTVAYDQLVVAPKMLHTSAVQGFVTKKTEMELEIKTQSFLLGRD